MSESYVDLSYRGLPLGRRIKLTQVRPSTAYLEVPTPMPVGTTIAIHTDDGLVLDALVRDLHEQVGGAEHAPGMLVAPALGDDKALQWWHARVTLPEAEPKKRNRDRPGTVRPRSATRPQPTPPVAAAEPPRPPPSPPATPPPIPPPVPVKAAEPLPLVIIEELPPTPPTIPPTTPLPPVLPEDAAEHAARASTVPDEVSVEEIELPRSRTLLGMMAPAEPPPAVQDEAKRTLVMDALDQEALQQMAREAHDTPPEPSRTISGEHVVIDDGLRTVQMDAVDVRALGLEPSTSGPIPTLEPAEDDGGDEDEPSASESQPAAQQAQPEKKERGGFFRRRKKKR